MRGDYGIGQEGGVGGEGLAYVNCRKLGSGRERIMCYDSISYIQKITVTYDEYIYKLCMS